ncbi:hypothetical protein MKEN_01143100 [Mycena kentingensis (nom. inval.)]|nr:hypothetical protein MKEN_01143100 [Mycena kentingensis (nom. inval.)]
MLSLDTQNLSLYSIPVVWATAFLPTMLMENTSPKSYNNIAPRSSTPAVATNKAFSPEVVARIERMNGAHKNGMENLPIWVAAVLAATVAKVDVFTLNTVSIAYIFGRVVYNYIYFNQKTEAQSYMRTAVFFSTLGLPMYLLVSAAGKVASQ